MSFTKTKSELPHILSSYLNSLLLARVLPSPTWTSESRAYTLPSEKQRERKSKQIVMEPKRGQVFGISGPFHLKSVNWNDAYQKRAVMASLVKGVSVMEKDRHLGRLGPRALAPPWWQSFGFELDMPIEDDTTPMIIGAIYKLNSMQGCTENHSSRGGPPTYIVAFRGTIRELTKGKIFAVVRSLHTTIRDFFDDFRVLIHRLHNSTRIRVASETVSNLVKKFGAPTIYLAGHSLGSSVAMLIGQEMARLGFQLETYLFNPPFIAPPIEQIGIPVPLSRGIRFVSSMAKVGLTTFLYVASDRQMEDSSFMALSTWVPHIFVSPHDLICSGYIGYFQHRIRMEEIGFGTLGNIATQHTYTAILSDAVGLDQDRFQPVDVVPSAHLTINRKEYTCIKAAHKLREWWHHDLLCESTEYRLGK